MPEPQAAPPASTGAAPLLALLAVCAGLGGAVFAVWSTLRARPIAAAASVSQIRADAARLASSSTLVPARLERAPTAQWIWSSATPAADERVTLARTFTVDQPVRSATLRVCADNAAEIELDGTAIGQCAAWQQPLVVADSAELAARLGVGEHRLVIRAANAGGPAGVAVELTLVGTDGTVTALRSDPSWTVLEASGTERAVAELGPMGIVPWGAIEGFDLADTDRSIALPEGFACELVATIPADLGSVVSLAAWPDGSLSAGVQGKGLLRVRPAPLGSGAGRATIEREPVDVGGAQGLAPLDGSLYASVNGAFAEGSGLYRLDDTDGDGRLDRRTTLRLVPGQSGEHGMHGIALGPDGRIYVMCGNHCPLPSPERSLVPRRWGEDILLPRLWDANGHAVGIMAPGGWVCRTDREGKTWEVFAIGFRNAYDLAFTPDGELLTYDSDMEWDMGAPWYRPTRIVHVVSGGEYGWRSGSACWPAWYPDSLPPIIDVGPGSPTGLVVAPPTFPAPWAGSLLALDWTFGTIHAIRLEPDGATYRATREPFLTGKPLPLTDAVISPADGALYLAVGGRRAASAIYRVFPSPAVGGDGATVPALVGEAPRRRRQLERLHGADLPASAIDEAWPALDDPDRFVRFAARTAIEHQPVERWRARALAERRPSAAGEALLALARCGEATDRGPLLGALAGLDWDRLDRDQRRAVARATMVAASRLGLPTDDARLLATWDPRFPSDDPERDRVVSELLVAAGSTSVVAKAVAILERDDPEVETFDAALLSRSDSYGSVILRMAAASPQRQQVHMATALRRAERGWSDALRERYFRWFAQARRTAGGMSFTGFLEAIRKDALERAPETMRARLERISSPAADPIPGDRPLAQGPGRKWNVAEVERIAAAPTGGRDLRAGERMFAAAGCVDCHRIAGIGSAGGPDLSSIGNRFGPRELAQAIVEPSAVISDQYRFEEFVLADGTLLIGRVVSEENGELRILENLLAPDALRRIAMADVRERRASPVSPMMAGLVDPLSAEEVADLLAYLRAGGDLR